MKTIHTRDYNNQGNKISCTVDVKDGEDVITSEVIEFRTKDEMNSRLTNILNIVNGVAELFPTLTDGEWTEPTKVEKTTEKIAQEKANQVRQELHQAKEDFSIGLMTDMEYQAKVTTIKASYV